MASVKSLLLEELFDADTKLKGHTALHIPPEVIYEVVDTVETRENVGVKVDWIERVVGKILKVTHNYKLIQTRNSLRAQIGEMQKQLDFMTDKSK